ncbi:hypothetical protein EXN66_Car019830 [Channa argus]|uniref:Uncharacterized protein n=1 Tax=Channa argus TaxID=215402 RepID=A0A6G1QNI5_CHAAH|nr:hypothetical protein EXN66_Car019830 [Channa argus]
MQSKQYSGFIPMMHRGKQTCKDVQSSFRRCSPHSHTHAQENLRISTVISSHTAHT